MNYFFYSAFLKLLFTKCQQLTGNRVMNTNLAANNLFFLSISRIFKIILARFKEWLSEDFA